MKFFDAFAHSCENICAFSAETEEITPIYNEKFKI